MLPRKLRPVHMGNYLRSLYFRREVAELPVRDFQSVLDAGCGGGHYALELARRYPHLTVVGYDLGANFSEHGVPNVHLEHRDLLLMNDEELYDFVYCIDVLEHIPDNRRVIANIRRALKLGGYFYLHMPYDYPGKRILPERLFEEFERWARTEHVGLQYDLEEAFSMLRAEGFEILRGKHTFGFVGELAWELDKLAAPHTSVRLAISPLLRAMGRLAVRIRASIGNVLIIARRPAKGHLSPE